MLGVSDQSLSYLDGTLPGDYGFDPLGLSDPEGAGGFINPGWLAYAEVIHGRWAMLGVAGATAPETMKGFNPDSTAVVWCKNGIIPAQGSYDFWAPPTALFWVYQYLPVSIGLKNKCTLVCFRKFVLSKNVIIVLETVFSHL